MAADSGTYDQATIARRQKIAEAMLGDAMKPRKIEHWAQGLAQMGQAGIAGYLSNQANEEAKASRAADTAALAALLGGGGAPAATPAAAPAPAAPAPNPVVTAMSGQPDYGKAISAIESGGSYDKLGPVTKTGDRAYGKYQVMGNNIPEWSKTTMGYAMTPEQFLKSPEAQEAIFKGRFGSYVDKYGPEGAAKAWFAGEKGMNNPNAKDMLGTSVAGYGQKFMKGLEGQGVTPVAQAMAPPQMPQGQGGLLSSATPQQRAMIMAGMNASEGSPARAIAMSMITNMTKGDAPTDEIKEYNLAKSQGFNGSFVDFKTAIKKAGATNVTTNVDKGEDSFAKAAGSAQAKRFDEIASEGPKSQQMMADIDALTELGRSIGTGKGAEVLAKVGPFAESLGVSVKGLNEIQAFEAIVNRMAPSMRVPGSGSQSDMELKNFLKSLPSIGNTPGGNEIAAATLKGVQQNKVAAAEIASKALNGEITRPQAEKMLRELPDPMEGYRNYMKANKEKVAAPATSAAPDRAAIEAEMRRRGLLK